MINPIKTQFTEFADYTKGFVYTCYTAVNNIFDTRVISMRMNSSKSCILTKLVELYD